MMFSLDFTSLLVAISWLGLSDPDAYYLLDISPEMCLHATSHVYYSIRLSIILIYNICIWGSASDVYRIVRNSKTAFCAVWRIFACDIGTGEILLTTTFELCTKLQIKLIEMLVFNCLILLVNKFCVIISWLGPFNPSFFG